MSAASSTTILDLRRMLAERFPAAHGPGIGRAAEPEIAAPAGVSTGLPPLDRLLGNGLPKGEVTELVGDGPGSGSAQVIHALLECAAADGRFVALVDGADSFDVDAPTPAALERLLWVRCRSAEEALKAADLLLRDRNFPLVVLDLKLNPAVQLRKIPSSAWHRFGRIAEHNGTTLLVVTPQPLVGAVSVRVKARAGLGLDALALPPEERPARLVFELLRAPGVEAAPPAVRVAG